MSKKTSTKPDCKHDWKMSAVKVEGTNTILKQQYLCIKCGETRSTDAVSLRSDGKLVEKSEIINEFYKVTDKQKELLLKMYKNGLRIVVRSNGVWTHSVYQVINRKHKKEILYGIEFLGLKSLVDKTILLKTFQKRKDVLITNYYINRRFIDFIESLKSKP